MGSSARRRRWAERENARLAAEYQSALTAWRRSEQLIEWFLDQAGSVQPLSVTEGLRLRRNERVLWTSPNATMVEVPEIAVMFAPVHEVFSPTQEGGGYLPLGYAQNSVRDNGFVAVTDSRVVFIGARSNREWAFAQLDGLAHGAQTPMTLMRVNSRQRLSGLVFEANEAPHFQFQLALALAEYRNDRSRFVAHLADLLAQHRRKPPPVPLAVLASQAPSRAKLLARFYFGRPGAPAWRRFTPATVTLLGIVCLLGALMPPPAGREGTSADRRAPAAGPAALTTSPTGTEAVKVDTPSTTTSPPSPVLTTGVPKTVNLCGAPQNPWNYHFCRGSQITTPPDEFCVYFECIDNFWNGRGYVIQCQDNMFSKSGGIRGSCSSHGGNRRTLRT